MKLLLDTHTYIWWLAEPSRLTQEARAAIANPRNFVFVSAASVIEIAIKQANGELEASEPLENLLKACRFVELPLKVAHASALRELPPVHRDPFDRMLAAQARVEGMTLVSRDPVMKQYDVPVIAA
ncbi:MAG: type II toxin-antitoxin system VapC family toxin [Isosphaeraceae bacterium]|nr:type II toxin-antitoxin system VapC family toxin [Isosphaeraceae bacterium]